MKAFAIAAVVLCATPAWAVYQCGDVVDSCQCGAYNPYPCCDNGGNCTWYAWEAACCSWAVGLPSWGNANQWAGNAAANPAYAVASFPVTNAVSCRTLGQYGHVAFVKALTGANVTVDEQNCFYNYGKDTATYASSFFQGYITRAGQVQCHPGDGQTQACGNCGTQTRGCGNDGKWGGWSACGAQGECAAGATTTESCGACGTHQRACSAACKWAAWPTNCGAGPDPDGGTVACDTGSSGPCADGRLRCGDGGVVSCEPVVAPQPEQCDGIDNDCNGLVDDAAWCEGAPPLLPIGGSTAGANASSPKPAGTAPPDVTGGCSVVGAVPLAFAALLTLGRRRRR